MAENDRERIAVLESKILALESEVKGLEDRDRSRMRAAIIALGGLIVGLVAFIAERLHLLMPGAIGAAQDSGAFLAGWLGRKRRGPR